MGVESKRIEACSTETSKMRNKVGEGDETGQKKSKQNIWKHKWRRGS